LDIYSSGAAAALFAAMLALMASPLFSRADIGSPVSRTHQRLEALEGLRGFLALSVATHHGIIYYDFFRSGQWRAPPSALFNQLGQASVGLFFIITAYLFWGKALRAQGVKGFIVLLTGRLFRIAPVYCFLMFLASVASLMATGFLLRETMQTLFSEGIRNFAFGIFSVTFFNGANIPHLFAGVTWTLVYEWRFYLLLPLVALLTRRRSLEVIIASLLSTSFISWWTSDREIGVITLFLWGILCAAAKRYNVFGGHPLWLYSSISFLAFSAAYLLCAETFTSPIPAALLGVGFYAILCGGNIFGLLNLKSAKRLGAISYDLYLVHGLIFAAAFALPEVSATALSSPIAYWISLTVIIFTALTAALVLRVYVELPALAFGKRVTTSLNLDVPDLSYERQRNIYKTT